MTDLLSFGFGKRFYEECVLAVAIDLGVELPPWNDLSPTHQSEWAQDARALGLQDREETSSR